MRVELHVFGSFKGYSTLARSPGVSMEDARQLEAGAYNFGQPADARYAATLAKQPAWFTRVLAGQRRGLTRVLEGKPDDNGRPTLELVTAIVSQTDWDGVLWGDPSLLLANRKIWAWERAEVPAMEVEPGAPTRQVSARAVPRLLALISEVERCLPARRPVVVDPSDYSADDLAILEMLIPPAARRFCTTGVRTLSAALQVSVNCPASESIARATFRYDPSALQPSPYASHLGQTEFAHGAIPLAAISDYQYFGTTRAAAVMMDAAPAPASAAVLAPRRTPVWPIALVALFGLLSTAIAFVTGWQLHREIAPPPASNNAPPFRAADGSDLTLFLPPTSQPLATSPAPHSTTTPNDATAMSPAEIAQLKIDLQNLQANYSRDSAQWVEQKKLLENLREKQQTQFELYLRGQPNPFLESVNTKEKLKSTQSEITTQQKGLGNFVIGALTPDQGTALGRVSDGLAALESLRKKWDAVQNADRKCEAVKLRFGQKADEAEKDSKELRGHIKTLKAAVQDLSKTVVELKKLDPVSAVSDALLNDLYHEVEAKDSVTQSRLDEYESLVKPKP